MPLPIAEVSVSGVDSETPDKAKVEGGSNIPNRIHPVREYLDSFSLKYLVDFEPPPGSPPLVVTGVKITPNWSGVSAAPAGGKQFEITGRFTDMYIDINYNLLVDEETKEESGWLDYDQAKARANNSFYTMLEHVADLEVYREFTVVATTNYGTATCGWSVNNDWDRSKTVFEELVDKGRL